MTRISGITSKVEIIARIRAVVYDCDRFFCSGHRPSRSTLRKSSWKSWKAPASPASRAPGTRPGRMSRHRHRSPVRPGHGNQLRQWRADLGQPPRTWANPAALATVLRWLAAPTPCCFSAWRADAAQWRWAFSFLRECLPGRTACATQRPSPTGCPTARNEELRNSASNRHRIRSRHRRHPAPVRKPGGACHLPAKLHQLEKFGIHGRISTRTKRSARTRAGGLRPRRWRASAALTTKPATRTCSALAELAQPKPGVQFCPNSILQSFDTINGRITGVRVFDGNSVPACCGPTPSCWLRAAIARRSPGHWASACRSIPVKGYSITAPILDSDRAPRLSLTDESRRIVRSRLGNHRGWRERQNQWLQPEPNRGAAIAGNGLGSPARRLPISARPSIGVRVCAQPRRATCPLIGRTRVDNLFLNTGHGTLAGRLPAAPGQQSATSSQAGSRGPTFRFWIRGR